MGKNSLSDLKKLFETAEQKKPPEKRTGTDTQVQHPVRQTIKTNTFQHDKQYKFTVAGNFSVDNSIDEFEESREKVFRYLSDSGKNHIFENISSGNTECFTDAQLLDYSIKEM